MNGADPLVSAIIATRDRPTLLAVALRCFAQQTYARRELIVINDGTDYPADAAAVEAAGGTLLRARPGISLGEKTNLAIRASSGALCQIMDDDDYYAPDFLATMVTAKRQDSGILCYPTMVGVGPYTHFDVQRWELRRTLGGHPAGGSILFAREDWEVAPFRTWTLGFEVIFLQDQARIGSQMRLIDAPRIVVQIRHRGAAAIVATPGPVSRRTPSRRISAPCRAMQANQRICCRTGRWRRTAGFAATLSPPERGLPA